MPFGLVNAPATFQAHINDILRDLLDIIYIIYLNDILFYSETLKEHIEYIKSILDRL